MVAGIQLSPTNYLNSRIDHTPYLTGAQNPLYTTDVEPAGDNFVSESGEKCTDGKDDGKISLGSKIWNTIKGVGKTITGAVKSIVKHPIKTALAVGACCIPVVGPVIGGALAVYGIAKGGSQIINGIKAANAATTDAEAKEAWQNIGSGAFTAGLSVYGLKASGAALKNQVTGGSSTFEMIKEQGIKGNVKEIAKEAAIETKNNFVEATYGQAKKGLDKAKGIKDGIKEAGGIKEYAYEKAGDALKGGQKKLTEAQGKLDSMKKSSGAKADAIEEAKMMANEAKSVGAEVKTYKNGAAKEIRYDDGVVIKYNKNGDITSTTHVEGNITQTNTYNKAGEVITTKTTATDANGNIIGKSNTNYNTGVAKSEVGYVSKDGGSSTITVKENALTGSSVKQTKVTTPSGKTVSNTEYTLNGQTYTPKTGLEKVVIEADSGVWGTFTDVQNYNIYKGTPIVVNNEE